MEERIEQLKTTNRDQSPISNRQNINNKNNYNNKSYNTKNLMNSSMKKKNNTNQNTIESIDNKSVFESYNDEKTYQNLATKVRIQNNIIEEYQKWVNILLSAINSKEIESSYQDIGTPIQEGLEDIEKLKLKNFEIKYLIIKNKLKMKIWKNK